MKRHLPLNWDSPYIAKKRDRSRVDRFMLCPQLRQIKQISIHDVSARGAN